MATGTCQICERAYKLVARRRGEKQLYVARHGYKVSPGCRGGMWGECRGSRYLPLEQSCAALVVRASELLEQLEGLDGVSIVGDPRLINRLRCYAWACGESIDRWRLLYAAGQPVNYL